MNDASGNVTTNTTLLGQVATNTANIATNTANITTLQGQVGANSSAITTLQGQTTTLFNLANVNHREIRKANEGVAMALAMESPQLPAGTRFGVAGGVGYYNHRTAATASFAARIGDMPPSPAASASASTAARSAPAPASRPRGKLSQTKRDRAGASCPGPLLCGGALLLAAGAPAVAQQRRRPRRAGGADRRPRSADRQQADLVDDGGARPGEPDRQLFGPSRPRRARLPGRAIRRRRSATPSRRCAARGSTSATRSCWSRPSNSRRRSSRTDCCGFAASFRSGRTRSASTCCSRM